MTAAKSLSDANQVGGRTRSLSVEKLSSAARSRLLALTNEYDPLGQMLTQARRRAQPRVGDNHESVASIGDIENSATLANATMTDPLATRDMRLPPPGQWLRREYKGCEILVQVLEKGFEFDGKHYRSLSAIAKAVTGAHWNGHLFFGLVRQEK